MSTPQSVDVIVVGAGPVGLTAAIELRRRDLAVCVIDAKTGPSDTSRALGTHARTLEVYGHMGVLDAIAARAQPVANFTVYTGGRRTTAFGYDFAHLGPLIPHSAFIGQADTELVLRERLSELGVDVSWGAAMERFDQHNGGVTVRILSGEVLQAAWMVAADGGRSTARKLLGLPFDGSADETWIVTDAVVETDLPPNSIHMFRHPGGNLLMFPFPERGKWRLLETNPPPPGGEADELAMTASFTARMRAASGRAVTVKRLTWVSRFTIQQRQVPSLRNGRILLAGDAAHVHSPASGQGMNTGIQDAFNLAWKLALVHRGEAASSLLDTYDTERRPVSSALLRSAKIATRLIQSRKGLIFTVFGAMASLQDRIPRLHRRIEKRITAQFSALNVAYADSDSGAPAEAGQRFVSLPDSVWASPSGKALLEWLRGPEIKLLAAGPGAAEAVALVLKPGPFRAAIAAAQIGGVARSGWTTLDAMDGPLAHALAVGDTPVAWLIRPDGYLVGRFDAPDPATLISALERLGLVTVSEGTAVGSDAAPRSAMPMTHAA